MDTLVNDLLASLATVYGCVELLVVNRHLRGVVHPALRKGKNGLFSYREAYEKAHSSGDLARLVSQAKYGSQLGPCRWAKIVIKIIKCSDMHPRDIGDCNCERGVRWVNLYYLNGQLLCVQLRNNKNVPMIETRYAPLSGLFFGVVIARTTEFFNDGRPCRILDNQKHTEYVYRRDGSLRFERPSVELKICHDRQGRKHAYSIDYARGIRTSPYCISTLRAVVPKIEPFD